MKNRLSAFIVLLVMVTACQSPPKEEKIVEKIIEKKVIQNGQGLKTCSII
jgi:hypothetical protein